MKILIFFIVIFLVGCGAQAQGKFYLDSDSLSELMANQLLNNKETNHVLVFKTGTVGYKILREKDCGCEDDGSEVFIIWENDKKSFVRQIGCCVKDEVKPFRNNTLFRELIKNQEAIFGSKFKSEFDESHYRYSTLKLISSSQKQEIEVVDFLFAGDNKYRDYNLSQPIKLIIDKLELELLKK